MHNIFRAPVDNQHFKDTIEEGKSFQEIKRFLSSEDSKNLNKLLVGGKVKYWGSIPGDSNTRNFNQLIIGDELLCYRRGKYIALSKICYKTVNRELAKFSWGETEIGKTWELIYFLSDIKLFEIDSSVINKQFGFQDGPVMGFGQISKEKAKKFIDKFGSVLNFVKSVLREQEITDIVTEELSKVVINSPFEAQFYLLDLGNQLNFETYIPPSDAGHTVFDKRLDELVTVHKDQLRDYVAPVLLDPLSNIDVIWFKDNYSPKYFYEVIHKTGWSEAFLRLDLVVKHYDTAKTRIVGPRENESEFINVLRRWSGPRKNLTYKNYEDLIHVHEESSHYHRLLEEFLQ